MQRHLSGSAPSGNSWLDVQSAVRGLTQDFVTAFNTGNYDQAAALFTSDGLLMPPQREAVQGHKPIELMLRRLGEGGYENLRLETIRVEESGDMAVEIGRYTAAIHQVNGTTVVPSDRSMGGEVLPGPENRYPCAVGPRGCSSAW